jgi:hypothetical protein
MCPPQRFCDLCLLQTGKKRMLKKVSRWLENKSIFLLLPRRLCRAVSRLAPRWGIYISLNYRTIFFTTRNGREKNNIGLLTLAEK